MPGAAWRCLCSLLTTSIQAIVREYLRSTGCEETLRSFKREKDRSACNITRRSVLFGALHLDPTEMEKRQNRKERSSVLDVLVARQRRQKHAKVESDESDGDSSWRIGTDAPAEKKPYSATRHDDSRPFSASTKESLHADSSSISFQEVPTESRSSSSSSTSSTFAAIREQLKKRISVLEDDKPDVAEEASFLHAPTPLPTKGTLKTTSEDVPTALSR